MAHPHYYGPLLEIQELAEREIRFSGLGFDWDAVFEIAPHKILSKLTSSPLKQQLYWTNNKGEIDIKLKSFKAFAFKEEIVPNTIFRAVNREDVILLKNVAFDQWEIPVPTDDSNMDVAMWDGTEVSPQTADRMRHIEVYCEGSEDLKGYDRVMVLVEYQINDKGEECLKEWEFFFGVKYQAVEPMGRIAVGMRIDFKGMLEDIPAQHILSDFTVDHIYPVVAEKETEKLAFYDRDLLVGTNKGNAWYFGFRPRDDQSASLGFETRTLFEILDHTGAYQPTGKFEGVNDNTGHVSRNSDYFYTRSPNGATVVVRHYKDHWENWGSGNSPNEKEDSLALAKNPLPTDTLNLNNFKINGHEVNFNDTLSMAFRTNDRKELIAFEGQNCRNVIIDGISYEFSKKPA